MPAFRMKPCASGTARRGRGCSRISMRCSLAERALLLERPLDVLAHEGGGVLAALFERSDHLARGGRVAECDGDVAREALEAQAVDRRAPHALLPLRLGP